MQPYQRSLPHIKSRHQRGFTLIEIIMVVMILGLISMAVMRFYGNSLTATQTTQNASDALLQARLALERMVIDIRSIRSAGDITANTSSNLAFTDINNNTFNYVLSGNNLLCNSQVLATGINSLAFAYYDKSGLTTTTVANIRYIKITMNVTKNNVNLTLSTSIYLREMNT